MIRFSAGILIDGLEFISPEMLSAAFRSGVPIGCQGFPVRKSGIPAPDFSVFRKW